MVIADYSVESRFPFSVALSEHGVKSGVAVLVCGAEGAFGVLGAYDSEPNRFSDDSTHFLKSIAHALAAAADRRCAEEKLARMAHFDDLTGLPNRSLYMERLLRTTFEARRGGGTFGVLFIDIDRFKSINDTLRARHGRSAAGAGCRAAAGIGAPGRHGESPWGR